MATKPKAQPVEHRDKLGRLLAVGQFVAYPMSNMLDFGRVEKVNPKTIKVAGLPNARGWRDTYNKYPQELLIVDDRDMTWYLLKNSHKN